jgi:hypothetical protein
LSFALQVAGAVVVFVNGPKLDVDLKNEMLKLMQQYPPPDYVGESAAKSFWDTTHKVVSFIVKISQAISNTDIR